MDNANAVVFDEPNDLGLAGAYEAREVCALIHAEGARVLAKYARDFYTGRPALTVHGYGQGEAYYMASRNERRFLDDFYGALADKMRLRRSLDKPLPDGVTAQVRTDGASDFIFVLNFTPEPRTVDVGGKMADVIDGGSVAGSVELPGYGLKILKRKREHET
jgi:beta-galactosidase